MKFVENLLLLYWTCDIFTIEFEIYTQWKHFSGMVSTCELCEGNYEYLKGLRIHQLSCNKRFIRNNNAITTPLADSYENVSDAQIETVDILLAIYCQLFWKYQPSFLIPWHPRRNICQSDKWFI